MDKKTKILIVAIALALIVAITSTTYAFFTIANKEGEETVVTSGTMGLHLEDGPEVGLENAIPGSSVTKIFYVENTGNVDTAYDLYLSEVVNTFVNKTDLVYTLTSNDGGYSTTGQVQAPSASSKIVDSEPIEVGAKHHYTLVLTFLEKNENQDDNQGVEFSGKIQINEYKNVSPIRIVTGDLDTQGSEVCIGGECFYVIGRDENNKTKLLAKYGLGVGAGFDTPTNKQDASTEGLNYADGDYGDTKGTVPFTDGDPYWPGDIENNTYVYNNQASISTYVNNYVNYLETFGVSISGRLVNLEDMNDVGCIMNQYRCPNPPEWWNSVTYFTGIAISSSDILYIIKNGSPGIFSITSYSNSTYNVVRPVIILES